MPSHSASTTPRGPSAAPRLSIGLGRLWRTAARRGLNDGTILSIWRIRKCVLVHFVSDPALLHERFLLANITHDVYLLLTPDRDLPHRRFACPPLRENIRVSGDTYGEFGQEDEMYLMASGPLGDYTARGRGLAGGGCHGGARSTCGTWFPAPQGR
jgi:hypothetical protein